MRKEKPRVVMPDLVVCPICLKTIKNQSFHQHEEIHKETKYDCQFCGKMFTQTGSLKRHIVQVHGVNDANNQKYKAKVPKKSCKIFDCGVCGKTFASPQILTSHKITHTTVKPYPCKICQKSFNNLGTLSRHRKGHNIEHNL